MLLKLYEKWMIAWETALTTADSNRIERPVEWGFEHVADVGGDEAAERVARGETTGFEAMAAINRAVLADPQRFWHYTTPTDYTLEMRHPQLFPTNVRPETLSNDREWKRRAAVGELRKEPFLRFTSPVRTPHPENDLVNARWYEAEAHISMKRRYGAPNSTPPKQAIIVLPQWNADAFSHNALCDLFVRFGISCLRLSKPYHDIRRPAELKRADYAVSSNVGRTLESCRQAVADIRSCVDWLAAQGYTQFGVLGTSLGSCYAFLAAAQDPRIRVCAFNHASTQFGDVVWTGQSTRHIRSAFEKAGLNQEMLREVFACISPINSMDAFARPDRRTLVVYAPWDLTFRVEFSREVLAQFRSHGIEHTAKVLPCGHYTTGETPFKYIDGWYLGSFIWREFKRLRQEATA